MSDAYEETISDPENLAMRVTSGRVNDGRALVAFLYLLGRDELSLGRIEGLIAKGCVDKGPQMYTNGWLAEWAKYTADRLTAPAPVPVDTEGPTNG